MTEQEYEEFYEANNREGVTVHRCALIERDGQWILCLGETHSDGVFRHVDFQIETRCVEPALQNLRSASPEGLAEFEAMLRRARGKELDA